jgi:hypothetical protein
LKREQRATTDLHEDLSHLVSTLSASDVDDDVGVGEFGEGLRNDG